MTGDPIDAAARVLLDRRVRQLRFGGFEPGLRPADEATAYTIQRRLHDLLDDAALGATAGHKIGCTTPVMQEYLGIANPCSGLVLAPNVHTGTGDFREAPLIRPGVECEIAVHLRHDLDGDPSTLSDDRIVASVDRVVAAIEVVDDRYVDYGALDTPTLIADDFFQAGCVLGVESRPWDDTAVARIDGVMFIDGEAVGRGRSDAILGHPLNAIRWLAHSRAQRDDPLRAGQFVLLGSLVATRWVDPGSVVTVDLGPLGRAQARF